MKLSDLAGAPELSVVRDGSFASFGFLSDHRPDMLATLYNEKYLDQLLANPDIRAVLASPALAERVPAHLGLAVCDDPVAAFFRAWIAVGRDFTGWSDFASEISPEADIHPSAHVAPRGVRVGPGCRIHPNATVLERVSLGRDVTIGSGTVVGGDGFEVRDVDGRLIVVPHYAGIVIADGVTVKTNTSIDWGLFDDTEIGAETVIDNLVHVAHSVKIGRRCRIIACAMIGGSTVLADEVRLGPNCSVSNSLTIGRNARITMGAVVTRSVPENGHVSGNFAVDHHKLLAFLKTIR